MGNFSSRLPAGVVEDAGHALRTEASKHAQLRSNYFKQSQDAYRRGDKAEAKRLSTMGKRHQAMMEQANQRAASTIFKVNNTGRDEFTVDLHGLHVKEAIRVAEAKIREAKSAKHDHMVVIVGKGNHSVDNIPKIKPAIEDLMQRHKLTCTPNRPNPGCFYVEFEGPGGWQNNWFGNLCVIS